MRPVGQWSRRPAGPAYLEFIFLFFYFSGKHYIDSEIKHRGPWSVATNDLFVVRGPWSVVHKPHVVRQQASLLRDAQQSTGHGSRGLDYRGSYYVMLT